MSSEILRIFFRIKFTSFAAFYSFFASFSAICGIASLLGVTARRWWATHYRSWSHHHAVWETRFGEFGVIHDIATSIHRFLART
jgi:uncharacterized membrane protein